MFNQQLAAEIGKGRVGTHCLANLFSGSFKSFTFTLGEFLAQFRLTDILWPLFRERFGCRATAWLFGSYQRPGGSAQHKPRILSIFLTNWAFAPWHGFGGGLAVILINIHHHGALAGLHLNGACRGHHGRIVIGRLATKGPARAGLGTGQHIGRVEVIGDAAALFFGGGVDQPHQQEECHHCRHEIGIGNLPGPAMMRVPAPIFPAHDDQITAALRASSFARHGRPYSP